MNYRQKVGQFGELLAKNYLLKRNYEIIDINVKIGYQEIDIIAKKDKFYIFIEIKTRTSLSMGSADDAFDFRKMKNLKKALNMYIYEKKLDENYIKINLISVYINKFKKTVKIKHYKDIF